MSLGAGTRLGPYAIEVPLGAGGMGEVYRATDTHLKRSSRSRCCPPRSPATRIVSRAFNVNSIVFIFNFPEYLSTLMSANK